MANPLPKTNVPAFAKYQVMVHSTLDEPAATTPRGAKAMHGVVDRRVKNFGGARSNQTTTPAPRKSQMISVSVIMVTAALMRKMLQSNQSAPMVFLVSLYVLWAMMPM